MCWLWGFQQFGGLDNFCKSKSKSKSKGKGKGNDKGKGKGKGKRREASLRQSGSAFGAAIDGRAEEDAEKVDLWRRSVPQWLKAALQMRDLRHG